MKKTIQILILLISIFAFSQSSEKEIILTKVNTEIKGMTKTGDVSASSSIPFAGQKKLRKKARKKIIEQAKLLGADIVLITVDNFAMTPINNVNIEGVAYKNIRISSNVDIESDKEKSQKVLKEWKEVIITNNADEIKDFIRIKEYNVSTSIPFGGQKKLRQKAKEKMQKEAFDDGCEIILLQTDEFSMSPINTINLIGVGYKK